MIINNLKPKNMATTKKSPVANKIRNDSNYDRTRENMAEFKRGGKACKLMRGAFRELIINASDSAMTSRLVQTCMDILAGDKVNGRGERTVGNGEMDRLRNFNFNEGLSFNNTLFARIMHAYDRVTGQLTVSIPAFSPEVMVEAPRSTTDFVIVAAAVAMDFDNERYDHAIESSAELSQGAENIPAFNLVLQLPPNSTFPVFLALSTEFFQKLNGRRYIHKSENFNAATIVEVFKP
jgi:hypothetical protein